MKYDKIAIIGTGLIGGSIGKAVISRGLAREVVGVCRSEFSVRRALNEKAVTSCFVNNYEEALQDADIIFIATPVETVKKVLENLSTVNLKQGVIITDVGSTKRNIVSFASRYKDNFTFLGTHPLAGSEQSGVEYSSDTLFENSVCVLTPEKDTVPTVVDVLSSFWREIGAKVEILSPEVHDLILAYTSHLPHIAAYALAGAQDRTYFPFISTGFTDTTRVASSDPSLWSEILMANKDNILKTISEYKTEISRIEDCIEKGDRSGLISFLEKCKRIRDEIIEKR